MSVKSGLEPYATLKREMQRTAALVTGGFDPLHEGHLAMISACTDRGWVVSVALNSDDWLRRKKGYCLLPWETRAAVLKQIPGVVRVFNFDDTDGTALDALKKYPPGLFVNGGDRIMDNTPEVDYCLKEGIMVVFGAGGGKIQSSSDLVEAAMDELRAHIRNNTVQAEG